MSRQKDNYTMSLFGDDEPEKETNKPKKVESGEAPKPPPKPVEYRKPKDFYTYDEFLKRYCGDHTLAEYWWKKQMERREETKRICQ